MAREPDSLQELLTSIAGLMEQTLLSWRATTSTPSHRGYLFGYELELADRGGASHTQTVFVETEPEHSDGAVLIENPDTGQRVAVWLYPRDPALPALQATVFPDAARALLARLGVTVPDPRLAVLAYRPNRRAVIRVDGGPGPVYLKVVRPGHAQDIVAKHRAFLAAGVRAPEVVGWSADGLVAITALEGIVAQAVVGSLPDVFLDSVLDASSQMAGADLKLRARRSLADNLGWYSARASELLPAEADRVDAVTRRVTDLLARGRADAAPASVIHGDLHLGQLFVDPAHPALITGVLDIDTAGLGDPADDAAAFWAHLRVLTRELERSGLTGDAERARTLAELWQERWKRGSDAGFDSRARAIAATHLLGHALLQATPAEATALLALASETVAAG